MFMMDFYFLVYYIIGPKASILIVIIIFFNFRQPELVNGALIHGIESRVNVIESKLSDIDARTSEEADNALNERELDRFIMSGNKDFVLSCLVGVLL